MFLHVVVCTLIIITSFINHKRDWNETQYIIIIIYRHVHVMEQVLYRACLTCIIVLLEITGDNAML